MSHAVFGLQRWSWEENRRRRRNSLLTLCLVAASCLVAALLSGCNSVDDVLPDPENGGSLEVAVIEETQARTPEVAAVVRDLQFWKNLEVNGHRWRIVRSNSPDAAKYQKAVDEIGGLPVLVITRENGKAFPYKLPVGENWQNEITKLVKKYQGKRAGPDRFLDMTNAVRVLGAKPADASRKAKARRLQSFGQFLESQGTGLIPRDKWVDVEYPEFRNPEWVLNQHQTSGCVGFSGASAEEKSRRLRGMPHVKLSGAHHYSCINGGRDSGAYILDSMEAGLKQGYALKSEFDLPKIYSSQVSSSVKESALTRQSTLAWPINTIDELGTAIQMGLIVQCGVQVDGSFESFDTNGVSRARGRYANHSVHIDGMKKIGDRVVFHMPNTWGPDWGPFRDGTCYLSEQGVILDGDAYVHADSEWLMEKPSVDFSERFENVSDTRFVLAH